MSTRVWQLLLLPSPPSAPLRPLRPPPLPPSLPPPLGVVNPSTAAAGPPVLQVATDVDLLPGEELCISYIEIQQPRSARRSELHSCYCFDCACPRCTREAAEGGEKLSYAASAKGRVQRTKREQRELRAQRHTAKVASSGDGSRAGKAVGHAGHAGCGGADSGADSQYDGAQRVKSAEPWFASLA